MLFSNQTYIKEVFVMGKTPQVKPGLPNPWTMASAQIVTAASCKHHKKYSCETSPAETKHPKAPGSN
jgi:hypothetical protein